MKKPQVLIICVIVTATRALEDLTFPAGFKFGVASSSYQVEGAWNTSDKSRNMWDEFSHTHPERIRGGTNGDVACDSYHLWRRDVQMIQELGVHFYRFSINWPRLVPDGFATRVSKDGLKYYSDLIDALLEKNIEPIVTLYHWELPQKLQDLGGWSNPLISTWFADYARVVFSLFADRVKTWITLNEPAIMCDMAYNVGVLAPGIKNDEVAPYLCNRHVVIAHAKAWRIYDNEFREKYHGRVSIASQLLWFDPLNEEDEELAELVRLNMARACHPIFSKEGGWSPQIEKIIEERSIKLGHPRTNLPPFSKEEIEFVRGTYDFFGLNHYTSRLIRRAKPGERLRAWPLEDCPELNVVIDYHPTWNRSSAFWFYVDPKGIRKQLVWLKKHYGDLEYFITENGYPSYGGLNDLDRIQFYKGYLKEVLLAIKEDGVNVTGYTAWTLMDNFEWMDGYRTKFGLYEVDFTSPQKTRKPRASAHFYASVVAHHSLDVHELTYPEDKQINSQQQSSQRNVTEVIEIVPTLEMEPISMNERLTMIGIAALAIVAVVAAAFIAWRARYNRNVSASQPQRETYTSVKVNDR